MKTRTLFFLSLGLVVGCGPLLSSPGDDFSVKVTTSDLDVFQQVAPVEITFEVDGCDLFGTTIAASGNAPVGLETVITSLGGGRYRALVPPVLLHATDDYCSYDTLQPQGGDVRLEVTCRQDGRVQSTYIKTRYATSWRASYRGRGPSDGVFGGRRPNHFYDVGSGWLDVVDPPGVGKEIFAAVAPGNPPLLAESDDGHVYLHAGCPINDCGFFWIVDTPTEKVGSNAAYLQAFDFRPGASDFVRNVKVPSGAVDLATDPDGTVIVLAEFTGATAITRVVGESTSSISLDGESNPTRFASSNGARVFLTRVGDTTARLRGADGGLLGEIALPGAGPVSYMSIAPTGDAFVMFRGGLVWLTTLTTSPSGLVSSSTRLASDFTELDLASQTAEDSSFGAAWTDVGVAIRDRSAVEVYSRTAPFAQTWKTSTERGGVINALGMGTSLVLVTQTGLQIFDPTGKLTGGADPMPRACGLDYQPHHAAVVAPDTVALSGKRAVYQFRANLP
jgi:hypothetical protein